MKPRSLLTLLTLALAGALLAPVAARADFSLTLSGSNVNGPRWFRPIGSGPGISAANPRYHDQTFVLPGDATCYIYSAQSYDGYLHLYRGGFDPSNPLGNLVAGDDDGDMGTGTSQLENLALTQGRYHLVTSAFGTDGVGSFQNSIHCNLAQAVLGSCFFSGTDRTKQTCHHERFAVRIINITNHATDGVGTPVRFGSSDSAIFWFYNDRNFEVMVKVLNGCPINGYYWVFIGALTNQGYRLEVGDVQTQQINTYSNPLGNRAAAVADTQAFACGGGSI